MGGSQDFDTVSLNSQNGQKEKILVSVRLRPLSDKEKSRSEISDWECINNNTVIFKSTIPERAMFPAAYTFDRVFGYDNTTEQVYEEGAKEVALAVISGINSSIFAYGQTSSGKTYTMSGITEYAVSDIYDYIEKHREREFVLKFSAMEIYNEAVRDLLSADSTPLRLLDDPERGTVVERLTEETLHDWNHFQDLLAICEAQRHIGETSMNEMSSRSHQILRLTIESSAREYSGPDSSSSLAASVNFVDLAGSERASQTLSAGTRLKEGCHINRSLLTLGTVIRKLSKGRSGHVPYRDSKLTRILQNSLGGNARTAIICTMSPARCYVEQSRNTLLFANCAKEVATNAQVNVVMSDKALVKQLQKELARMENELRSFGSSTLAPHDSNDLLREKELQIEKMDREIKELTRQRDLAQSRIHDLLQSSPRGSDSGALEKENHERHYERVNSSNSNLDFAENDEDSFMLDRASQRLSISMSPKIGGPDQLEAAASDKASLTKAGSDHDDGAEDICKEVRCIEIGESRPCIIDQEGQADGKLQENEEQINYPEDEIVEYSSDATYDSLQKKIQDMQRTINCLANSYPVDRSSSSSDGDAASITSSKDTRSRSCRTMAVGVSAHPTPEWSDIGLSENPEPSIANSSCDFDNIQRKDYLISMGTSLDFGELEGTDNEKVVAEIESQEDAEVARLKQVDVQESTQKDDVGVIKANSPGWEMEFRAKKGRIIELWQACNVPVQHRTYFFLLFRGEPSDSIYMEVELRRLSFLMGNNESRGLELASSLKALNQEREMLGKRVLKKFRKKERESLYRAWSIRLDSKQRSQQLARKLWTDTSNMDHVEESARLVAQLLGLSESGLVPREMFGLSFSPLPPLPKRSFSWKSSISSRSRARDFTVPTAF